MRDFLSISACFAIAELVDGVEGVALDVRPELEFDAGDVMRARKMWTGYPEGKK